LLRLALHTDGRPETRTAAQPHSAGRRRRRRRRRRCIIRAAARRTCVVWWKWSWWLVLERGELRSATPAPQCRTIGRSVVDGWRQGARGRIAPPPHPALHHHYPLSNNTTKPHNTPENQSLASVSVTLTQLYKLMMIFSCSYRRLYKIGFTYINSQFNNMPEIILVAPLEIIF